MMRDALLGFAVAPLLLLSSCADYSDVSGTYVGDGQVSYRSNGGLSQELTTQSDRVLVKMTSRHYQYSEIEIAVRNCVVRSEVGETSWSFSAQRGNACTFDVPPVGPVTVKVSGGLSRHPPSRSAKPDSVQLTFSGTADNGDAIRYSIDAKPAK